MKGLDERMPETPYVAVGPRVAIRHTERTDRAEFTRLARTSAALHHPWLTAPSTGAPSDTPGWPG